MADISYSNIIVEVTTDTVVIDVADTFSVYHFNLFIATVCVADLYNNIEVF